MSKVQTMTRDEAVAVYDRIMNTCALSLATTRPPIFYQADLPYVGRSFLTNWRNNQPIPEWVDSFIARANETARDQGIGVIIAMAPFRSRSSQPRRIGRHSIVYLQIWTTNGPVLAGIGPFDDPIIYPL